MSEELGKLLLRLVAGGFLLPHGLGKLTGWFGGPGLSGFVGELAHFGIPGGLAVAFLLALVQTMAGLFVLAGLATRVAAAVGAGFLLYTAWLAIPNGWYWMHQGTEFPLFWALALVSIALLGPGALSVDVMLRRGRHGNPS
ncbi:DoxX family protein [Arenimonas aestuarii]